MFFSFLILCYRLKFTSWVFDDRGQAEKEFRVEVEAIGHVRHKNLVRLLGYCVEGTQRYISVKTLYSMVSTVFYVLDVTYVVHFCRFQVQAATFHIKCQYFVTKLPNFRQC